MQLCRVASVAAGVVAAACHPTPQPGGTTNTSCAFSPNQTGNGLSLSCTVSGPLPNLRVDPFASGSAGCGINSWTVFGQTVSTPMTAIYGQNGDDNSARVRVGVTLGPGTHGGSIAKDNAVDSCRTTVGPAFAISTSFAGTHIALIDKSKTPMCVFQSRLTLPTFNQTLTAGVPLNISSMTKQGTREGLEKRIDLEVAKAVNALLNPSALPLSDDVVRRSGRCDNDWQPFSGS